MKSFFITAIALVFVGLPTFGQTIKSLGYNTSNGQVVYSGTNNLTFTNNNVIFSNIHVAQQPNTNIYAFTFGQTNTGFKAGSLGGFSYYYNGVERFGATEVGIYNRATNVFYHPVILRQAATANAEIIFSPNGGYGTPFNIKTTTDGLSFVDNTAGEIATNFTIGRFGLLFNSENYSATTRANLGFSTNLNTLWTAINASNARSAVELGATWLTNNVVSNFNNAIGLGSSSAVTFDSVTAGNSGARFASSSGGGVQIGYQGVPNRILIESGGLVLNHSGFALSFGAANTIGAGQTRTNLGLGATWLTNTDVTNFRSSIGLGISNKVQFDSLILGRQRITNNSGYFNIIEIQEDPDGVSSSGFMGFASTNSSDRYIGFYTGGNSEPIWRIQGNGLRLGYSNSGSVRFLAPFDFFNNVSNAATSRTNLRLGAAWLTNTNATDFRADIGLGSNNSVQFSNVFITNSQAGNSTNYMLSIGAPDTGFTGVGGPAGLVHFRAGGTILWSATSTGFEFPTLARVRNTLDFQYGGGALGVISFSGVDPDTGRAISRTNLGLGGGITTNRTFVSYDGTNYTTNVVTISNGIITGWTQ